jgi:alpha-glucosidase (family GH31 glycosyl hydrolase)
LTFLRVFLPVISFRILRGATTWPVFLPEGDWFDLWTGERFAGNQTVSMAAPLDRIPVFVRAGTVIQVAWGPNQRLGEYVPLSAAANGSLRYG